MTPDEVRLLLAHHDSARGQIVARCRQSEQHLPPNTDVITFFQAHRATVQPARSV